jgi:hypothetical protein
LVIVLFVLFLLVIVLVVLLSFFVWLLYSLSFFFWLLYCLSFCPFSFGYNTITKRKRTKGQTIQ